MTLVDTFLQNAKELGADETVIRDILNKLMDDYNQRLTVLKSAQNSTKDENVQARLREISVIPFLRCDDDGIQAGFANELTFKELQDDPEEEGFPIISALELMQRYRQ